MRPLSRENPCYATCPSLVRLPSGGLHDLLPTRILLSGSILLLTPIMVWAQGAEPYPKAITDRVVRTETPMLVPLVHQVVQDPDFGGLIGRKSDGP